MNTRKGASNEQPRNKPNAAFSFPGFKTVYDMSEVCGAVIRGDVSNNLDQICAHPVDDLVLQQALTRGSQPDMNQLSGARKPLTNICASASRAAGMGGPSSDSTR